MIGVMWVVVGYSLAFGEGNAFIGDFSMVGLAGITPESVSGSIPTYVFVMFQGMFAIITPHSCWAPSPSGCASASTRLSS